MKYRELTPAEQEAYEVGYRVGNRQIVITDIEWESESEHTIYRKGYLAGFKDYKRKVNKVNFGTMSTMSTKSTSRTPRDTRALVTDTNMVTDTVTDTDMVTEGINSRNDISKSSTTRESKKQYGEFQKVKLADDEYEKLTTVYGTRLGAAIDKLDNYLAQKKKDPYASHYAVMKRNGWVYNEVLGERAIDSDIPDAPKRYGGDEC